MARIFLLPLIFFLSLFADITADKLLSRSFPLAGTFHPYSFYSKEDPRSAFNWVFRTPSGNTYQMMGVQPTASNVFGWKRVEIERLSDPLWDFYFIGDLDGDGDTRFDFILTASKRLGKIYKLLPVELGSFFKYRDLGYIRYQKDGNEIRFGVEAVRYLGLFDSLQDPKLPKSAAIVDKDGLERFIESYRPSFASLLREIDLEKYNIALFSFTLNGAESADASEPEFIADRVVKIPMNVTIPEIGIRSVVFYTFVAAVSKEVQRVVLGVKDEEIILNLSNIASDCSSEPSMPVCGLKQVQCITAPCEPVKITYDNYCQLKSDGAIYLHTGSCDEALGAEPQEAARSVSRFGAELLARLYDRKNIFLSPFSIFTALNMVYFGASGETREEFDRLFGYGGFDVPSSLERYITQIAPKSNVLEIANSAWFEQEFRVFRSYEEMVRDFLHSEIYREDFLHEPDLARQKINDWVEEKTHDKIKDLLPQGSIVPDTRAVLVNAVYFLGEWMSRFEQEDTKTEPFYLLDGSVESTAMMNKVGDYNISRSRSFEALELAYRDREVSMWIVLPKEGYDIEDVIEELSQGFDVLFANRREYMDVEIKVPRFKLEWGTKDISSALKAMGLQRVFDVHKAQLEYLGEPLDPEGRLSVDGVFHKAFVEVDERGSEAAAATAVTVVETTAVAEPMRFYANRPFLFAIVENRYNSPLFMGVLTRP